MRRTLAAATTMLLMLGVVGGAMAVEGSRYEEAVRSRVGVISSESTATSEAGLKVLDVGDNAMDTAVATTFAFGVARPQSCGIGGGGFLIYRGADGETAALDFRETAPAAVTPKSSPGRACTRPSPATPPRRPGDRRRDAGRARFLRAHKPGRRHRTGRAARP